MRKVDTLARATFGWLIRKRLHYKKPLRWWLVYGPVRTGTSLMLECISTCSRLCISDWGLRFFLCSPPATFPLPPRWLEYSRLLRDVSRNLLDNATAGKGHQLDLVYKQAGLTPEEYDLLVQLFGAPERNIFCLREPTEYIASARKKFPGVSLEELQREGYIRVLEHYDRIGGDLFEYTRDLTVQDYISFLRPLRIDGMLIRDFRHSGNAQPEFATEEMWAAYRRVRRLSAASRC